MMLVGRERELAVIDGVLRTAADGPRAIVIVGEPGIGKTALLDHVVADAAAHGRFVVRVGSSIAERDVAWSGLVSLLTQVPDPWIDDLPEVQRHALDVASASTAGSAVDVSASVAAALRSLFRRMAASGGAVIALDDLQWTDSGTIAACSSAFRTLTTEPLAVVVTQRPAALPYIDFERVLPGSTTVVEPRSLDRTAVHDLMRDRAIVVAPAMLDDIHTLGSGNPLHTNLLIDHIVAHGWRRGSLPRSILLSHEQVLQTLDENTLSFLQFAAVYGRLDTPVLAQCLPEVDVDKALLTAERTGLVVADGRDGLTFSHPTVVAAIVAGIGPTALRQVNRVLAAVVPDSEQRAVHLGESTVLPDADVAAALEEAAQLALGRGAREVAGQRFLRAEELTPPDARDDRWRRALSAADAFVSSGNLDAADAPSLRAFETAADPVSLALAGGVRAQFLAGNDRRQNVVGHGDLLATHRFVVGLLAQLQDVPFALAFLGRARVRIEQTFDLALALDTSLALHDQMATSGIEPFTSEFACAVANCRYVLGDPVDIMGTWRMIAPIADPTDTIGAGWMALELLIWSGIDDEFTLAALDDFEQRATAAGAAQAVAKLLEFRGNLLIRAGRWVEGEDELHRAVDAADLSDLAGDMSRSSHALALAGLGRLDEARATAARSFTATATTDTPLYLAAHQSCLGFIELCAGRWDAAVVALTAGWDAAEQLGLGDLSSLPFRTDLVEALVAVGRLEEAAQRTARIVDLASRSGLDASVVQAQRAVALVETATGNVDAAIAAAEIGLARHRNIDAPFERARLLTAYGGALRRARRRRDAGAALQEAAAVFERLDAVPFLQRVKNDQRRLGTGTATDGDQLTVTERHVAELVAAGRSNTEVATELMVSLRTVESNLTRIYRKLGVRTRTELALRLRAD
jgi:DNA-binding CsgD family transcriptional regulator